MLFAVEDSIIKRQKHKHDRLSFAVILVKLTEIEVYVRVTRTDPKPRHNGGFENNHKIKAHLFRFAGKMVNKI